MEWLNNTSLLFIYNADKGWQNAIIDSAHKILSPKTYQCQLCEITHGYFTEKKKWKGFIETYPRKMEFLHRDEFKKQYASKFGYKFNFPVVLISVDNDLQLFISTKELNGIENQEALIALIKERDLDFRSEREMIK